MKIKLANENAAADKWLPDMTPDGSEIGANYADAYVKPMNKTLDDGTEVRCNRRGLKITVQVGERKGEALLRRLEHGPDVRSILQAALHSAFEAAGVSFTADDGEIYLDY